MVRWGSGGRLCLKKSLGRKEPSAPVGRPSRPLPRKVPPVARRKVIPKIITAPLLLESEGWASDGSRHHSARRDPYGGPVQVQEVRQDFVEIRKLLRRTDGEGALALLAGPASAEGRMVFPAASSASDSRPGGCFRRALREEPWRRPAILISTKKKASGITARRIRKACARSSDARRWITGSSFT
jgi:hypothetical protein